MCAQEQPTLCNPMDCSPPGSSVCGISQARLPEWVATPFSRGSSWPRGWTRVSHIVGRFFTIWPTRETAAYDSHESSDHLFYFLQILLLEYFQAETLESSATVIHLVDSRRTTEIYICAGLRGLCIHQDEAKGPRTAFICLQCSVIMTK